MATTNNGEEKKSLIVGIATIAAAFIGGVFLIGNTLIENELKANPQTAVTSSTLFFAIGATFTIIATIVIGIYIILKSFAWGGFINFATRHFAPVASGTILAGFSGVFYGLYYNRDIVPCATNFIFIFWACCLFIISIPRLFKWMNPESTKEK